jgi:CRP-like cAMP-binding protein
VFFVVEGRVRVVNFSISGRKIRFDEMERGGVFGELAALDGMPRPGAMVALNDTLVATISPDTFLNLLRDYPDLAIGVMQELAKIVRASTERIMDLSTLGALNRVHSEILREARACRRRCQHRPHLADTGSCRYRGPGQHDPRDGRPRAE